MPEHLKRPPGDCELTDLKQSFDMVSDPPRFTLDHYQRYGPVFSAEVLTMRLYCLAGGAAMKVFYDEANVLRMPAADYWILRTLWSMDKGYGLPPLDGAAHRVRKANFLRTTTWAQVDRYLPVFHQSVEAMFSGWRDSGGSVAAATEVNRHVLNALAKAFFSTPLGEKDDVDVMVDAIVTNFAVFNSHLPVDLPMTIYERSLDAVHHHIHPWLQKVLDAHRNNPNQYNDALSLYLQGEDVASFTDHEIITDLHQYFIGGYGVSSSIPLMLYSLARNPEVVAKLKQELADQPLGGAGVADLKKYVYADWVANEVLRFWPAVPIIKGQAARDIDFAGYRIPKGGIVIGCLYATCHDEAVYTNPGVFDPDRFSPERNEGASDPEFAGPSVAFGAGSPTQNHRCGGQWVAHTFLKLTALLAAKYWSWELANPNEKIEFGNLPVLFENNLLLKPQGN